MKDEKIEEILLNYKNIATIGFSNNSEKPARRVPAFFIAEGYNVIPVNPNYDKILGRKSYKSILEIPDEIDVVQVFRPSNDVPEIVEQVIKRKMEKGDVKVLWLSEGYNARKHKKGRGGRNYCNSG